MHILIAGLYIHEWRQDLSSLLSQVEENDKQDRTASRTDGRTIGITERGARRTWPP